MKGGNEKEGKRSKRNDRCRALFPSQTRERGRSGEKEEENDS